MYRVLLPLDNSESRAHNQTSYVLGLPCAEEEVRVVLGHAFSAEERQSPQAMRQVDRVDTVRRARDRLEEAGIDYEIRGLSSPPADGILSMADECDEIVMGGRKRSPVEKAILGSVTQRVVLNAEVPVTVTGDQPRSE